MTGTFQYDGAGTITATDGTSSIIIFTSTDFVLAKNTFHEFVRISTVLGIGVSA